MGDPGSAGRHELLSQVRGSDDRELFLARLTLEDLKATDPALAETYAVAALPRRFDRALIEWLVQATGATGNEDVFERLVSLSEVQRRKHGSFALHNTVRAPLLRLWQSDPERADRSAGLHEHLAKYFLEHHDAAMAAEDKLRLCSHLLSEVNADRYIQVSRTLERELAWPLAEALYHETARSPSNSVRRLLDRFNENQASYRLRTCSALVDAYFDAVTDFAAAEECQRLWQWATYFQARLFLSLEDFQGAEVVLKSLQEEGVVDPILRIWIMDERAAAAYGLFQLDRALELHERAVQEREAGEVDVGNLPVAMSDRGRAYSVLWDEASAQASYEQSLGLARHGSNPMQEFDALVELAPTLAATGRLAEGAAALLEALHLARTARPEFRASLAYRIAGTAINVFVQCEYEQAETVYQEARSLLPAGTRSAAVVDFDKNYLNSLAALGLLGRARELDSVIRDRLKEVPSHVRARALLASAKAAFARYDMVGTLALGEEILALHADATVEPWEVTAARTDVALACINLGRLDDAERLLGEVSDDWCAMGHRRGRAFVALHQAELARRRGDLERAEKLLQAGEVFVGTGTIAEAEYENVYASIELGRCRWPEAVEGTERAASIALARKRFAFAATLLSQLVVLRTRVGDHAGARSTVRSVEETIDLVAERATWLPSAEKKQADAANAQAVAAVATLTSKRTSVLETAARQLQDALAADSHGFWYALNLAYVHWELGSPDQVKTALGKAETRASDGPFADAVHKLRARLS